MRSGWYQVAYLRDLADGVHPLECEWPLAVLKDGQTIKVFDARCPHRGAHLGHGGTAAPGGIVCPFHGKLIALRAPGRAASCDGYELPEYASLALAGMLFVHFPQGDDPDIVPVLRTLASSHYAAPGFSLKVRIAPEWVVENGFDAGHFRPVHQVCRPPELSVSDSQFGELRVVGTFTLPRTGWQRGDTDSFSVSAPYTALGLSPGLILSQLGGKDPYWVLTAATPVAKNESIVRLSVFVPRAQDGSAPTESACNYLIEQSRKGLERDIVIWEHMNTEQAPRYAREDAAVIAFREFLSRFPEVSG